MADTVSILIVRDLRLLGFPMGWTKNLLQGLFSKSDSALGRWSSIELSIYFALDRRDETLVVSAEGHGSILPSEVLYKERKRSQWELSPYVCLPFSEYIVRIVGTLGEKLEPARFYRPFKFRPEYNKIVELVRNSDYEEIHIYKQDGQIKKVKTVSVKRGQFSTSDLNIELNKSDFQKIEVFKDKGVIVTLKSEENRRL